MVIIESKLRDLSMQFARGGGFRVWHGVLSKLQGPVMLCSIWRTES
jgi:hypothetical protein